MAGFDGSITAHIGADLGDYERAMSEVQAMTKRAFDAAQKAAANSASQMVQKIGQLMARLASSSDSMGSKIGKGLTGSLKIALGELQRMISNIGQRLPEPIRIAAQKMANALSGAFQTIHQKATDFGNRVNSLLTKAFKFDFKYALSSPKAMFAELNGVVDRFASGISGKLLGAVSKLASAAGRLPGPFGAAFGAMASKVSVLEGKITGVAGKITRALGSQVLNPVMSSWSSMFSALGSKVNSFVDRMSNSLGGRLASSIGRAASQISGRLGGAFSSLGSKGTSALSSISAKFASASSSGNQLGSTVRNIVSAFSLLAVAQKGIDMIKSSIDGAISRVDTMNRFPRTMALFGYSAQESKAAVDQLSKGIEGLPTTLDSAVSSAQQLAITTGSLEKGTKLALAFNNAMLGYGATTEGAEQALRQFNQSLGSGKIQAEEFNSVSEAAPGLMNKMAKAFGFGEKGVQDFKKALSEGEITADEFADKLIELNEGADGFAKMAMASAAGIRTAFNNIKNAITKGVGNIIQAWDQAAEAKGLGTIYDNLMKVKEAVNKVFDDLAPRYA